MGQVVGAVAGREGVDQGYRAPPSATRATTARPTARPPDPAASAPSFQRRRTPRTGPLSSRKRSTALAPASSSASESSSASSALLCVARKPPGTTLPSSLSALCSSSPNSSTGPNVTVAPSYDHLLLEPRA